MRPLADNISSDYHFELLCIFQGRVEFQGSFADFSSEGRYLHFLHTDDKIENEVEDVDWKSKSQLSLVVTHKGESDDKDEPQETKELIAKGDMSQFLYWKYFRATNSKSLLIIVGVFFVLSQSAWSGLDYWLGFW